MAVTYTDVQQLAAEFASLGQERIEPFITRASLQVNSEFWGDLYDTAVLYLAAHLLATIERGQNGGAVLSETAGPLSRTYAVPTGCPARYAGTSYGLEFWSLLQTQRYKAIAAI